MQNSPIARLIEQAREQLTAEFRAQSEQIQKLEQALQELRGQQRKTEESLRKRLDDLANVEIPAAAPSGPSAGGGILEQVLAAVRDLITATLPEQVLEVLTDEGSKLGVRTAVFDVRGKAAWGSSARGFAGLSDKVFRGLVVPLSQETPFRTCFETAGHVDTNAAMLRRNRNILDRLRPDPDDAILLLPVRSAGSVSAIFYADTGGKRQPLPVDALKILAEFAGAQLDRLMALSGGMPAAEEAPVERPEVVAEPVVEEPAPAVELQAVEAEPIAAPEPSVVAPPAPIAAGPVAVELTVPSQPRVEAAPVMGESVPEEVVAAPAEELPPPLVEVPLPGPVVEVPPPPPPPPAVVPAAGFDISQLSEEDQKNHRDAKRFAKLLVSEIELYNKAKVQDGRKNRDLYKRLKSDIDRSRQTYEKRFGKTVGKQYDYFHEELVRILAGSDAFLLGPEYPGPTV